MWCFIVRGDGQRAVPVAREGGADSKQGSVRGDPLRCFVDKGRVITRHGGAHAAMQAEDGLLDARGEWQPVEHAVDLLPVPRGRYGTKESTSESPRHHTLVSVVVLPHVLRRAFRMWQN